MEPKHFSWLHLPTHWVLDDFLSALPDLAGVLDALEIKKRNQTHELSQVSLSKGMGGWVGGSRKVKPLPSMSSLVFYFVFVSPHPPRTS